MINVHIQKDPDGSSPLSLLITHKDHNKLLPAEEFRVMIVKPGHSVDDIPMKYNQLYYIAEDRVYVECKGSVKDVKIARQLCDSDEVRRSLTKYVWTRDVSELYSEHNESEVKHIILESDKSSLSEETIRFISTDLRSELIE